MRYDIPWTEVSDRFKNLRAERGYTQLQISENVSENVSQAYISNIERGNNWSTNILLKCCEFLNVSIDWMLGRSELDKVSESDDEFADKLSYEEIFYFLAALLDLEYITYKGKEEDDEGGMEDRYALYNDPVIDKFLTDKELITQIGHIDVMNYWYNTYLEDFGKEKLKVKE